MSPANRPADSAWWRQAFINAVATITDQAKMTRGRAAARSGQVISMRITERAAVGEVQGSQPRPFAATFALRPLSDDRLGRLTERIARTPGMLTDIVSGTVSPDLGPLLLPSAPAEFDVDCTCPDPNLPCAHIAALAYLVAERLQERPADILTLRSIDSDALIASVQSSSTATSSGDLYGEATQLPPLPLVEIRPAIDDLDPTPLRAALRLVTPDDRAVAAAMRELQRLYHAVTDR